MQSGANSSGRQNVDLVQLAIILGLNRLWYSRMERRSIAHRCRFDLAASFRLLRHWFFHLGPRCRRHGKAWCPISYWVPCSLSVRNGHVRLDVFCLHPGGSRRDLVRYPVLLRSQLVVDVSALHLWIQMGGLAEFASSLCGRHLKAAALLLLGLADGASLCE
jgi:hypothetical protein